MAEFEALAEAYRTAGYELAAVAVDDPSRSEPVRQRLHLSFPIVCDPSRELLKDWDLLNDQERGGIAVPSVFVLDRDRRVTHRWFESTATRVTAESVLATLQGHATAPKQRTRIGLGNLVMALGNTVRRGGTTPRR